MGISRGTVSLIILNVILTAFGGDRAPAGFAVSRQPMIWAGFVAYGASLLVWLAVLAPVPVIVAGLVAMSRG